MKNSSRTFAAVVGGLAILAAGCDSDPTALDTEQSAVLLQSTRVEQAASQALFSIAGATPPGGNKVDLSTVDAIEVQITRIALRVESDSSANLESETDATDDWVDVELAYDPTTFFDLRDLASAATLGTVPEIADGEISAVRLYFGDARVIFMDGSDEDLFIPSGKVTIPTANVAVNQGEDISLIFATATSVKKINRTGRGLLMPPVFRVSNDVTPDDLEDDGNVDDDSDDDGEDDGNDDGGDDTGGDGTGDGSGTTTS